MNAHTKRTDGKNNQLSARFGITPYSDLTEDEFLSLHLNKHIASRLKMNQLANDGKAVDDQTLLTDAPLTDYEKYNYIYADKKHKDEPLPDKVDWYVTWFLLLWVILVVVVGMP